MCLDVAQRGVFIDHPRYGGNVSDKAIVPLEKIERHILLLRGEKVLLDSDLADMYGVPTKVLNQAVKRNIERFPKDFMFRLNAKEAANLMSQSVTSSSHGGRRKLPYAFTEQG